jgi:hypothetical protein
LVVHVVLDFGKRDRHPLRCMGKSAEVQEKKGDRRAPLAPKSAQVIGNKGDKSRSSAEKA